MWDYWGNSRGQKSDWVETCKSRLAQSKWLELGPFCTPSAPITKAMKSVCCYLVLELSGYRREDPELPPFLHVFISCTGVRPAPKSTIRSLEYLHSPTPVLWSAQFFCPCFALDVSPLTSFPNRKFRALTYLQLCQLLCALHQIS